VQATQGTLVSETKVELDGHKGRELTIAIADGRIVRSRIFLVEWRLYQMIAEAPNDQATSPLVERFLMSFRLTK
jgi:hypothetical protein